MLFVILSVVVLLGAVQCDMYAVVNCLSQPANCDAQNANANNLAVLNSLGWNSTTCMLPYLNASADGTVDRCQILNPNNTVIKCTISATANQTVPDQTYCYYANLQVTGSCDDIINEFILFANDAVNQCNSKTSGGNRRRRSNAFRSGVDISF